jgi:hypothetical protein
MGVVMKSIAMGAACIAAVYLADTSRVFAAEQIDVSEDVSAVTFEAKVMPLDERRTAILWRGANTYLAADSSSPAHLAVGDCYGVLELVAGEGMRGGGPCAFADRDGELLAIRWWRTPGQKEGNWEVTGGIGKWAGARGGGTYTFSMLTPAPEGAFPIPATGKGVTNWNGSIELP